MSEQNKIKSGFVAVIGRPNAGKSTLINRLINNKISIVSGVPQTTRHLIRGILNDEKAQVVFLDTPGIHAFKDSLSKHFNTVARQAVRDIELILYVADVSRPPAQEEEKIVDFILKQDTKVILAFNKMDLGQKYLQQYIDFWQAKTDDKGYDPLLYYVPVSAKNGKHLDKLKEIISHNLPWGVALYSRETKTDFPLVFTTADIIREKLLLNLSEEMPHVVAVETREITEKEHSVYVSAYIYVNRLSQKKIIVGKGGKFIKRIGYLARRDMQDIFQKKVYLDLWVDIAPDWQKKERFLKKLGYQQ
jgi:GTP-binding protein Era